MSRGTQSQSSSGHPVASGSRQPIAQLLSIAKAIALIHRHRVKLTQQIKELQETTSKHAKSDTFDSSMHSCNFKLSLLAHKPECSAHILPSCGLQTVSSFHTFIVSKTQQFQIQEPSSLTYNSNPGHLNTLQFQSKIGLSKSMPHVPTSAE